MVRAKNLQVPRLIPQTQPVVCLKLVPMAGSADALKVFAAVWITGIQSPDEPCRHDVVHMAPDSCLLEIHSAGLYFAVPPESWRSQIAPSLAQWAGARPLALNAAPAHWPLLSTEARPAVQTSPVAIGTMAAVHGLEHFCSSVSAIWTTHCAFLLPPGCYHPVPRDRTRRANRFLREQ